MIMGEEGAASQQPSDDEKQAGTTGSIYSGKPGPAQHAAGDDPDSGSIYSGDPEGADPDDDGGDGPPDDGPPDDGSIYSG